MARMIMLNVPLHGHINPTLAVIQELVASGEEVIYYASDDFKARLEQTGATFRPYHSLFSRDALQINPVDFSLLVIQECLHVLPQLLDEARALRPDYILYDALCLSGRFLAELLHVPAIMLCSSYAGGIFQKVRAPLKTIPEPITIGRQPAAPAADQPVQDVLLVHSHSPNMAPPVAYQEPKNVLIGQPRATGPLPPSYRQPMTGANPPAPPDAPVSSDVEYISADKIAASQAAMRDVVAELRMIYGLDLDEPSSLYSHAADLNIVFVPRAFQVGGDDFDSRFVFVGPSPVPQTNASSPVTRIPDRPTLYISLGTLFNDWPEFFATCMEAFGNSAWQVVMSIGDRIDPAGLGVIPDNITVAPYVPQLAVLANTDAFITHGGMNSTLEALSYGIPLVVIPQMAEQAVTAQRVAELGLGLALDKNMISADLLRDAVSRVLNEPGFREQTAKMQEAIRTAGGYKRAAAEILEFSKARLAAEPPVVGPA